ncbi:MAG TPA: DUF3291 domain-containing protein [Polyangiaceae bacterium]|jgi:hypothetical protein|nr:DUF3291 domain-containing protein [Polyangiaceae bacterium]
MNDARHIAQINVGRMVAPLADPVMAGFASRLDAINALADAYPGFVWRLRSEAGDATAIRAFDDPLVLVNMSVWESIDALHAYVYRSDHVALVRDRKKWFVPMSGPYYALWWVAPGHRPSVQEGKERLECLAAHGPSEHAFWFVRGPEGRVATAARERR